MEVLDFIVYLIVAVVSPICELDFILPNDELVDSRSQFCILARVLPCLGKVTSPLRLYKKINESVCDNSIHALLIM